MEREQLKEEILDQLRLEKEIKEQLKKESVEPAAPKPFAWLESKLGLLVVGAIVSGILVPTFQFTQETFKWTRQNRYNALTNQVSDMRDSMKQLVAAQALIAETYNIGISAPDELREKNAAARTQAALARVRDVRLKRLQQNAAFASTFSYFPANRQGAIRKAWQDYLEATDTMQYAVENLLQTTMQPGRSPDDVAVRSAAEGVGRQVKTCNDRYQQMFSLLQSAIEEVQREGMQFQ